VTRSGRPPSTRKTQRHHTEVTSDVVAIGPGGGGAGAGPRYVGGGWYELPDGTKVQGRAAVDEWLNGRNLPAPLSTRIPEAPIVWSEETQAAWQHFWTWEPIATRMEDIDRPAVERLFRYYEMWTSYMAVAEDSPMVEGSMGQVRVNPAQGAALALEDKIRALEDEFGIKLLARRRLGLTEATAALTVAQANDLARRGRKGAHGHQDPQAADDETVVDGEVVYEGWEEA